MATYDRTGTVAAGMSLNMKMFKNVQNFSEEPLSSADVVQFIRVPQYFAMRGGYFKIEEPETGTLNVGVSAGSGFISALDVSAVANSAWIAAAYEKYYFEAEDTIDLTLLHDLAACKITGWIFGFMMK